MSAPDRSGADWRSWLDLPLLVIGAITLHFALDPGASFATLVWLSLVTAVCWFGGGLLGPRSPFVGSRPVFGGRPRGSGNLWSAFARRPSPGADAAPLTRSQVLTGQVLQGLGVGLAAAAIFIVGARVTGEIPMVGAAIDQLAARSAAGNTAVLALVAVITGAGEEAYFRGTWFTRLRSAWPVLSSTVVYTLATGVTGNIALVLAAVLLGLLTAWLRLRTGGVLTPMLTHLVWSLAMLLALPLLV